MKEKKVRKESKKERKTQSLLLRLFSFTSTIMFSIATKFVEEERSAAVPTAKTTRRQQLPDLPWGALKPVYYSQLFFIHIF